MQRLARPIVFNSIVAIPEKPRMLEGAEFIEDKILRRVDMNIKNRDVQFTGKFIYMSTVLWIYTICINSYPIPLPRIVFSDSKSKLPCTIIIIPMLLQNLTHFISG